VVLGFVKLFFEEVNSGIPIGKDIIHGQISSGSRNIRK
jgi:hypothetical protein